MSKPSDWRVNSSHLCLDVSIEFDDAALQRFQDRRDGLRAPTEHEHVERGARHAVEAPESRQAFVVPAAEGRPGRALRGMGYAPVIGLHA